MAARSLRVMVATDFSPTAEAALEWAAALLEARGGTLVLVHALDLHGPLTDFLPSPADLDEHVQGAATARLAELAASLGERGIAAETRLELGVASQAVVRAADELRPDLMVVGSRGLTGVAHLLLGSTAQRIVQHAPCPVLTVHPGDRDHLGEVRHVLLPTDFSHDAELAARAARDLLGATAGARITVLHAYHLPVEYTAYGTIPTGLPFQQDVAAVADEKLAEVAATLAAEGLQVDTLAREGYPPDVIVDAARELAVDVIAMCTHGRTGLRHLLLGSNAERVVEHAPCPVLTVRHTDR